MPIDDLVNKGKEALSSDKVEEISDAVLDKVADLANKVTGGNHADKVESVRQAIDDKIGNE